MRRRGTSKTWLQAARGGLVRQTRPILKSARGALANVRGISMYLGGLPPPGDVRVAYGHSQIPTPAERVQGGGMIKLQALQRAFPGSQRRFNVLYLVTSRLPDGPVQLARYAQRKGARLVVNQNGVAYPAWYGQGWEAVNAPMATLLHLADHVFYQSRFCRESADRYLGERAQPSEILYNTVDTDVFSPARSAGDASTLRLLLAGSQRRWYLVASALEILALVARERPGVELVVTGRLEWIPDEAAAMHATRKRALELGVGEHVRYVGPYSRSEAVSIFRRADILLQTKYNDPCPTVVVEAMACGLPVVYSSSGGVPELVGEDAGIGVSVELSWERDIPADPELMAQAVLEVAERRVRFAEAARQRAVEKFDVRPWLRRHAEVFERLIG